MNVSSVIESEMMYEKTLWFIDQKLYDLCPHSIHFSSQFYAIIHDARFVTNH